MSRTKRWAWRLGVVLALAGVLWLLWPGTPSTGREASRPSTSNRAGPRGRGPGTAPGDGGAPGASDATARGDGFIRGVVHSLIGQPLPGVSIVALAVPPDAGSCWAGSCGGGGMTARQEADACLVNVPPLEETFEAVSSRVPVLLRTTTDAEGAFALTGLKEGLYEVWAEAPHGVAVRKVATGTEGTFFVLEEGRRLAGFTRDREEGPVAGASVVLLPLDLFRHFETVSGADGHFTFERVPSGQYRILGAREDLLTDVDELHTLTQREVFLLLQPARVITGQVLRRGEGVPGARVHAKGLWYDESVLTDGKGRFTFDGLRFGSYTVSAHLGQEGAVMVVHVEDVEPTPVVLTLEACAVLEGGVTAGSGPPLAEAEVNFQLFMVHESEQHVRTDTEGRYRFDCVLPGAFELSARAKGFRARVAAENERPLVAGETRRIDFRLSDAAPFDGLVVDPEGQPVPGAQVMMYWAASDNSPPEDEPANGVAVVTGEDGRFSADGLAPGLHILEITPPSEALETTQEQVQVPGTGGRFVLRRARPRPGVVVGTVVDERGQPRPGVRIEARRPHAFSGEFHARTDELGQFRLEKLPVTSWLLIATHEGSELTGQVYATARVAIEGPEPVTVRIKLSDGLSVSGRVVDGRGAPVPFAYVTATREDLEGGTVEADAEGRFTLGHLWPGKYDLEASPQGSEALLATTRTLVRAGDTDVRIVLDPMRQVRGRVVHADGSPVPAFSVNGTPFNDTAGRFSMPLPPPGPFVFVFMAEGLAPAQRLLPEQPAADVLLPDVVLVRGRPVRGRVLDADTGKPLEEAWVVPLEVVSRDDFPVDPSLGWTSTQAEGRFLLPAVAPGTVLTVERHQYESARVPVPRGEEEVVIRLRRSPSGVTEAEP